MLNRGEPVWKRSRMSSKLAPPGDIRDLPSYRFAAITTVNDRIGQFALSRKFGLSLRQWRTLGVLDYLEPCALTTLANESFLDKGQVSRVVAGLVADALVARLRVVTPDGGRGGLLRLTAKGRQLHNRILAYSHELNAFLVTALKPQEVEQLMSLLERVHGVVQQRYAEVQGSPKTIALEQAKSMPKKAA